MPNGRDSTLRCAPCAGTGGWHSRSLAVLFVMGFAAVRTNTLGAGDRLDRLMARVRRHHPSRAASATPCPTIVVTPEPTATPPPTPAPVGDLPDHARPRSDGRRRRRRRSASRSTWRSCATTARLHLPADREDVRRGRNPMVLNHPGPGTRRPSSRTSWRDASANGRPGTTVTTAAGTRRHCPGAGRLRRQGLRGRAYQSRGHACAMRRVALTRTGKPVVLLPVGAHTWVMTGYRGGRRPDHLPRRARQRPLHSWIRGTDASLSIWVHPTRLGNFEDAAEMKRNFIRWSRPEGAYPGRDGLFVLVVPTR